jgi:electron transport complex protein RnfB
MHTVLAALCTGCELCVAPCPVDCISMVPRAALPWAPPAPSAADNRARFAARNGRDAARAAQRAQLLAARKLGAPGGAPAARDEP